MRKSSFFILAITLILGCSNRSKKIITTTEPQFKAEGILYVTRQTDTLLHKLIIEVADTPYERETGMMYRSSMKKHQGMLFVFNKEAQRSFYMKNTEIPLDIIYLNKNLEVVSIIHNAEPMNEQSLSSKVPAQFVLELLAGQSNALGLLVGDQVSYYTP